MCPRCVMHAVHRCTQVCGRKYPQSMVGVVHSHNVSFCTASHYACLTRCWAAGMTAVATVTPTCILAHRLLSWTRSCPPQAPHGQCRSLKSVTQHSPSIIPHNWWYCEVHAPPRPSPQLDDGDGGACRECCSRMRCNGCNHKISSCTCTALATHPQAS